MADSKGNKSKDDIYLTAKISVIQASEDVDIAMMALMAKSKQQAKEIAKN
jgi:hypothetical protein